MKQDTSYKTQCGTLGFRGKSGNLVFSHVARPGLACMHCAELAWPGLAWSRLGLGSAAAGLGWAGLSWAVLGWAGLSAARPGLARLGLA